MALTEVYNAEQCCNEYSTHQMAWRVASCRCVFHIATLQWCCKPSEPVGSRSAVVAVSLLSGLHCASGRWRASAPGWRAGGGRAGRFLYIVAEESWRQSYVRGGEPSHLPLLFLFFSMSQCLPARPLSLSTRAPFLETQPWQRPVRGHVIQTLKPSHT